MYRRHAWKVLAGVGALVLGAPGCGDGDEEASSPTPTGGVENAEAAEENDDSEYCALTRQFAELGGLPTAEQLAAAPAAAPEEISVHVATLVATIARARETGESGAALDTPALREASAAVEAYDRDVCGIVE